jgi:hypothetical protein
MQLEWPVGAFAILFLVGLGFGCKMNDAWLDAHSSFFGNFLLFLKI